MYNRYVPQPDGSFRRSRIQEPGRPQPNRQQEQREQPEKRENAAQPCPQSAAPPPPPPKCASPCRHERCNKRKPESHPTSTDVGSFFRNLLPKDFDTADLLIVLLLLLMAGDCAEDQNSALLTLALYLFL